MIKIIAATTHEANRGNPPLSLSPAFPSSNYSNSQNSTGDGWDTPVFGRVSSPLGNNTKSASTKDPNTTDKQSKTFYRRKRYNLLEGAKKFSPMGHRVKQCSCHPGKDKGGDIRDHVSVDVIDEKAKWRGINLCGSVWSCPVCSARIQAERSSEVLSAMKQHRENGGVGILITYTYRHKRHDSLLAGIDAFSKALRRMKGGRPYKRLIEKYHQSGSIKALEITHGVNGFHPHVHEIWFLDESITQEEAKELESELFELWLGMCKKWGVGLPTRSNGVRVDARNSDDPNQDSIGSYVVKWAAELTGNINKKSRHAGRTPWQILEALCKEWTYQDDALWKEYCNVMRGRRMLIWSKDLKDRFGINDIKGEEEEGGEKPVISDSLMVPKDKFYSIVKAQKLVDVLEVMESHGSVGASEYIDLIHKIVTDEEKRHDIDKSRLRKQVRDSTEKHMRDIRMIN